MNTLIALLLIGQVTYSEKDHFLQECQRDCFISDTMKYVLETDDPELWVKRFKRVQQKGYQLPYGNSFYLLPKKKIKTIVERARVYGINLEK